jgi:hypothetical protein
MSEVTVDPLVEKITQRIRTRCQMHGVEPDSLILYVTDGLEPGGFLTAVLEDSLVQAAARADSHNMLKLYEWASVMYNDIPMDARGSKENVRKWIRHGGLKGLIAGPEPSPDPVLL